MSQVQDAQLWIAQRQYDRLAVIADREGRQIADLMTDLILTYESEQAKMPERTKALRAAIEKLQDDAVANGTSEMTMEEIDEEIAACRAEMYQLARTV